MTTFHTDPCTNLPAPAPSDPVHRPQFRPFVAVKRNRLVTIIALTTNGHYVDKHGYLHRGEDLERDLVAYAEQARADRRDQVNTLADALR